LTGLTPSITLQLDACAAPANAKWKWIHGKADETDGLYVMSIDEFIKWVRREF